MPLILILFTWRVADSKNSLISVSRFIAVAQFFMIVVGIIRLLNCRVVVLLRHSSDDRAVPFITIPAASKDGCASFEGHPFCCAYLVASYVGVHQKGSYCIGGVA